MNCSDYSSALHDYLDGELPAPEVVQLEAHLAGCAACRATFDSLRALRAATAALPREIPPARDLWPELEERLEAKRPGFRLLGGMAQTAGLNSSRSIFHRLIPLAAAAGIALLLLLAERHAGSTPPRGGWEVAALDGMPRIGARDVRGTAELHVGQWLETDATSRAKVSVASIGEVNVEPNSRLRLVGTSATEHRVELARGSMRALIWAPPRLFFVDTPSATAIDLGCAYALNVDDHGDGELRVTSGYVALEHDGREAIIPKDFMCLTRAGAGPGTPFAVGAPADLRAALARFDFGRAQPAALTRVLALARAEDVVTLWHLLARTTGNDRAAVFDTLVKLSAPPAGVTRSGILAGDAAMRARWAAELGLTMVGLR
jgi:hypothetical protein